MEPSIKTEQTHSHKKLKCSQTTKDFVRQDSRAIETPYKPNRNNQVLERKTFITSHCKQLNSEL